MRKTRKDRAARRQMRKHPGAFAKRRARQARRAITRQRMTRLTGTFTNDNQEDY